jgi:hypothetical protein
MDAIIARLSALTLTNLATTAPEAVGIESVERALNQPPAINISPSPAPSHSSSDNPVTASIPDGDLKRLCLLDEKFDTHMKSIILSLDGLSSPDASSQSQVEASLTEEKHWLQASIRELHGLQHHCDADIQALAEAMRDRMAQFTSGIDMYLEVLRGRSPSQSSPHVVNAGEFI